MQITKIKWTSDERDQITVTLADGSKLSAAWPDLRTWHREFIQAAIDAGMVIEEPDPPPPPSQDELDAQAARSYAKLNALKGMTPAQVDAWVENNVNTLAQAKDAIKTLSIGLAILARRI